MTQLNLWDDAMPNATPKKKPELKLFVNDDIDSIAEHQLARCIFAETLASSLCVVEALCRMVQNTKRDIAEIANDKNVFESLSPASHRHKELLVDYNNAGFQMVLRCVRNMKKGIIQDKIFGATRFHRADIMPEWANSVGSISEIDNLFFYI